MPVCVWTGRDVSSTWSSSSSQQPKGSHYTSQRQLIQFSNQERVLWVQPLIFSGKTIYLRWCCVDSGSQCFTPNRLVCETYLETPSVKRYGAKLLMRPVATYSFSWWPWQWNSSHSGQGATWNRWCKEKILYMQHSGGLLVDGLPFSRSTWLQTDTHANKWPCPLAFHLFYPCWDSWENQ